MIKKKTYAYYKGYINETNSVQTKKLPTKKIQSIIKKDKLALASSQ